MAQTRIALIIGSLRRDSFNRKLADGVIRLAPPEFSFDYVSIADLPLYNQDDDPTPSDAVKRFKGEIAAAQGLMFVTPEYNRSIPGVLKNAIDHGSRPPRDNSWKGKPAGIIGASPGPLGTALAQQHLRNVMVALDAPTLPQPEVFIHVKEGLFDEAGNIGPASKAFLQGWMDRYVAWVKRHAG